MSTDNSVIAFEKINKMLDNDPAAIKEFSEAALESFSSFKSEFRESMENRDLDQLRKVGHRIKPVAQMLGVDQLVDLYYQAKELLKNEADTDTIEAITEEMDQLCDQIIDEFKEKV